MKSAATKYILSGFAVLPVSKTKQPARSDTWKDGFPPEAFENVYGIGIICGAKSKNIECMDFDNHFGDAKVVLADFVKEIQPIYKKYKFPVAQTQSGGYHLLYSCPELIGNQKLAQRGIEADGVTRPDAIIETRGDGGYFVVEPTPGYKFIRNSLETLPEITTEERQKMFTVARSMNQWEKPSYNEQEKKDRPGDLYNQSPQARAEMIECLITAGWSEIRPGMWRRPGKKENGASATLDRVGQNMFYVFSSNAYPFEPNRTYTPFQVVALLKHNGDFSAFAGQLSENKKPVVEHIAEVDEWIKKSYLCIEDNIIQPPIILSINENKQRMGAGILSLRRVFTLGNFSSITGKWKSKKTYFLSMITAALVKNTELFNKFYASLPEEKRMILYFDTEQGDYDVYNVATRIIKLSDPKAEHFGMFRLRQFMPKQRCEIIERCLARFKNVGFVVIDGVADLANAINDEDEATRVVSLLMRWTAEYGCHISTVIHQNKGDSYATGHLGSSIMKKSEIVISVTKNQELGMGNESEVSCDMSRGADFDTFSFLINDRGMPELCDFMESPPKKKF